MLATFALISAILVGPQDKPDPGMLSGAALASTLDGTWWCATLEGQEGCSAVRRYDFRRQVVEECGGSDVAWIEGAMRLGEASDLESVAEVRPLLDTLQKEVEAGGYTVIKVCRTQQFEARDDALCGMLWSLQGKPRMWLSRSGRWDDPEDYVLSRSDAERYWWLWPKMFAELEEEGFAGVDLEQQTSCIQFSPQSDGTLVENATIDGEPPHEQTLVQVEALETVTILPWMTL